MKPIRVFNYTLHKEMWKWLADNPGKHKEDWPGWERFSQTDREMMRGYYECFACYAVARRFGNSGCYICPIDWRYKTEQEDACYHSVYMDWEDAMKFNRFKKAADYARIIANLLLKENLDNDRFAIVVI